MSNDNMTAGASPEGQDSKAQPGEKRRIEFRAPPQQQQPRPDNYLEKLRQQQMQDGDHPFTGRVA